MQKVFHTNISGRGNIIIIKQTNVKIKVLTYIIKGTLKIVGIQNVCQIEIFQKMVPSEKLI